MLDKSIPYYPLTLIKTDTESYPEYRLPDGYEFVFYQKGDEVSWADIECSVGQFDSVESGVKCFRREFENGQNLKAEERMLFVKDMSGEYVATGSLWNGRLLGEEFQRIHWIAVKDKCSGKGIAKALITRLLSMYNSLGYSGFIYLLTGTRNFAAVNIYRKFGFEEYCGERSLSSGLSDKEFREQQQKAILIINEKISSSRG
ncbi:MAG: GNAT family N-acetyltransferase [Clostridia bacterium]|nr:GNAT family N-acetyltransferase [Clostridia bacterium]